VQRVTAETAVQDQAVERLLHLVAASVQLVEEQHVRLVARDGLRRAEPALRRLSLPDDPGHADEVLGGELRAEQRVAVQANLGGELLHQAGLADAGLTPDKDRPYHRDVQEEFGQLRGSDRDRSVHIPARVGPPGPAVI